MKPSGIPWLGDVPEGWEIDKIKHHLRISSERNPGDATVLSLYREYGVIPKDSRDDNHNVTSEDTSKYRYVREGDFAINKMKAWQGSMAVSGYEGIVSPAYYVYRFDSSRLESKYFHHLIRTRGYASEFRRLSTGVREGQWDLHPIDFENTRILLPPLPEQRAIAERIDCDVARVDALREKIKREIERLGDYKKSLIAETVTRGLRKRKMKPSGIPWLGDVPSEWEVTRLKYIITANDGGVWGDEPTGEGDTIVLRSTEQDISGNIRVIEPAWRHLSQGEIEKAVLKVGDLIITKSSGSEDHIGKTSLIVETIAKLNCCYSNFLQRIRVTDNPKFIWYVLNSEPTKEHFRRVFVTSTGLKNLNAAKIESVVFARPPLPEQREIAEYLDRAVSRIDAVVARRKAQLEKLEAFKRSLIQEYVTGKREVR